MRLAGDLLLASRDVMFVVVFVFEVSLSKFVRLAGDLLPALRDVMFVVVRVRGEPVEVRAPGWRPAAAAAVRAVRRDADGAVDGAPVRALWLRAAQEQRLAQRYDSLSSCHTHTERKVIHARQRTVSLQQYTNEKMFNRQVDRPTRCRGTTSSCR